MKFISIISLLMAGLAFSDREEFFSKPKIILTNFSGKAVGPATFNYTIAHPCRASAGVYKNDSILIRTLWNNIEYAAGNYTGTWDGNDDYGNPVVSNDLNYKIKILTSNVKYTWQGTIGNTSDSMTGASKHRGYYHCMRGLAFGPAYGYFCTGYSEGSPGVGKFLISKPQQKINPYYTLSTSTADFDYVVTDGIKVYWGGLDANAGNNSFVTANNVSNDAPVNFSNGVSYTPVYRGAINVISYVNTPKGLITGLAVQKAGIYLFVARGSINQLQVLNKTTGTLVQTLNYEKARGLSTDASGNLWMVTGMNTVAKYNVNTDGTLTGPALTITGLIKPTATQVSTDGHLISIADDGTSQQVKFFNSATGALINTLGMAGGYLTNATVTDDKFYWSDVNGSGTNQYNKLPFIAYQPDGSFWVNDPGNFRVQHYTAGRTYMNRIMSLGSSYAVYADRNNINKVFSNFLEFAVDYSVQTLTGAKGWSLVKNWGAVVSTAIYGNINYIPKYPVTLSNGRTYALIARGRDVEVIEFAATNKLRFTGVLLSTPNATATVLADDGALQVYVTTGDVATLRRYPLSGFDDLGNPSWSSTPEILATAITNNETGNPVMAPRNQAFSANHKIVFYNYKTYVNTSGPVYSAGYHLGLMERGASNVYLFQTEKSTHRKYQGPYPNAGWFDVGNLVNDYGGGNVNIIDKNIITSYHGEGWKNSQTNKFNHYYDNGLAIGQFGTTRPESGQRPAAMMCGNALTPTLVKDPHGDLYLWHGDESDHAGLHRWKITGLNTIAVQEIPLAFSTALASRTMLPYTDLMEGLPFNSMLTSNTNGWSREPGAEINIHPYNNHWKVNTSVLKYEGSPDIYINFAQPQAATYTVCRDLGNNKINKGWKITGNVNFGAMLNGHSNNAYLEVLDPAGKVLTTLYATNEGNKLHGNEVIVGQAAKDTKAFETGISAGTASFSYGGGKMVKAAMADRKADWTRPTTLRLRFISKGILPNYNLRFDVSDLKFYKY